MAKIAFISNRGGNTSLWVETIPGGAQAELVAREKRYLKPWRAFPLRCLASRKLVAARVFVTGADGRAYAPDNAWMQAMTALHDRNGRLKPTISTHQASRRSMFQSAAFKWT